MRAPSAAGRDPRRGCRPPPARSPPVRRCRWSRGCARPDDSAAPPCAAAPADAAPAALRAVRIEPGQQGRRAPQRALARTGCVDQDAVELTARSRPVGAVAAGRGDVDHAEPVEIALKRLDACVGDVVRDERPAIAQGEGDLRGLAAGCGAQIQHPLTGCQVHQHGRQLRDLFLSMGQTGAVPPVAAGLGLGEVARHGRPGTGCGSRPCSASSVGKLSDRDTCGVSPDAGRQRPSDGRGEGVPVVDQVR